MERKIIRREGFWKNKYHPNLPDPRDFISENEDWNLKRLFLKKMRTVEMNSAAATNYRGWSNCRICEKMNGSAEYKYKGWIWPEGYYHYINIHNLIPSLAFQEFIFGEYLDEGDEENVCS